MGKMKKTASLLLALMLIWQLFALGVPSAYADGDTAMKWAVVCSKDGEQLVLSDVQAVTEQLGSGFVFEAGAAEPTVADLQKNGLRIAPPAGWVFRSLLIVTEGQTPDPTSKSLLSLAQLDSTAAGAIFLPAAIFADGFDAFLYDHRRADLDDVCYVGDLVHYLHYIAAVRGVDGSL